MWMRRFGDSNERVIVIGAAIREDSCGKIDCQLSKPRVEEFQRVLDEVRRDASRFRLGEQPRFQPTRHIVGDTIGSHRTDLEQSKREVLARDVRQDVREEAGNKVGTRFRRTVAAEGDDSVDSDPFGGGCEESSRNVAFAVCDVVLSEEIVIEAEVDRRKGPTQRDTIRQG